LNPVTYQVVRSRLSGIVQEMQDNIFRTGYSVVVRESNDASCVLLDAAGDVVGEHCIAPSHMTSLPEVARAVKAIYGDDVAPGDAFLTNHPYLAGMTHSMDMAVLTPVFVDGRLIAFCSSIAHKTDLGGVVPGTANGNAREIFQEGVQYPPVRIERGGRIVRDVEAILRANSRTPDIIMGDIRGQIGVARLGEGRLAETIARYGLDQVLETFALMQDVSERTLRAAIVRWSDGVAEAEHFLDRDVTELVRFHVRVTKRAERIHFDFSGCDDQVTSPINLRPPLVRSAVAYALIAMVDPTISNNAGVQRVAETTCRAGSIVDPHFPAPTNSYFATQTILAEISIRAMSAFTRGRKIADSALTGAISIGGERADGSSFLEYEIFGSASGGRSDSDGISGLSTMMSNVRCAPIEIVESEYPVRIRNWDLVTDSGGAGEFRGGLGARRTWEVLCPSLTLTVRGAGNVVATQPLDGGRPGGVSRTIIRPGSPDERLMPAIFGGLVLSAGDVFSCERGGGGGLGDPRRRPRHQVVDDVIDGYVTVDAAVTDYGIDRATIEERCNEVSAAR
jgi:N-methylhydantoinase B